MLLLWELDCSSNLDKLGCTNKIQVKTWIPKLMSRIFSQLLFDMKERHRSILECWCIQYSQGKFPNLRKRLFSSLHPALLPWHLPKLLGINNLFVQRDGSLYWLEIFLIIFILHLLQVSTSFNVILQPKCSHNKNVEFHL